MQCSPFIYYRHCCRSLSFHPPARFIGASDGPPSVAGLHELSASLHHGRPVTGIAGELLPHLLTLATPAQRLMRRSFSSGVARLRRQLPVRKRSALRCPDFPPVPKHRRQTGQLFHVTKVAKNIHFAPYLLFFHHRKLWFVPAYAYARSSSPLGLRLQ